MAVFHVKGSKRNTYKIVQKGNNYTCECKSDEQFIDKTISKRFIQLGYEYVKPFHCENTLNTYTKQN